MTYTQPVAEAEPTPTNSGGGAVGASGGGSSYYIPQALPLMLVTTPVALVPVEVTFLDGPADSTSAEPPPAAKSIDAAKSDAKTFAVDLSTEDAARIASFIENGSSDKSKALGSGERRAVIRDIFDTIGRAIPMSDIEKLVQGQTAPGSRNIERERAQLQRSRSAFRAIYGHDPNFKNTEENLAWNTLMYRIRFPRDLKAEKIGIKEFKATFGKDPKDPFQWATVRVMGYVNR